ncbi:centromere protein Scm3-domain-containing protein [Phyllosticta citribraziliensis]
MLSSYSRWNVDVPPNIDLDRRQERNRQRMKSRFERIFEQYERDFTGQDDEIDLETGEIVVNNGHLESMPDHDGSEEFGGLLNLGHDAQYHDDYFHGAELTPRGDDEEDELAAMCPVGLLAVAVREPSPRPAGSPAASPIPQANAPEETPHDTSGKVDQVTEMEKQIQQMSRQLQELRQLVTQPSIQPLAEPERPKDPKWYAPPLPNPPRIYRKSEDSVWDAPPLPGHLPRQENPKTSPVHDIEELEIPGPTEATAWDLATPVEMVRRLWTEKENELILELRGKNLLFREIAAQLPGRTTAQVVTHWHTIQDRLDKQNTVSESFERDSERCEEASNAATRRREKLPLGSVDKNSEEINLTDASSAARENETSTESNMSEFDKSVAQPPEDVRLETQPPEHSCQSSTQSLAEEVREWCKSKIGATDNPRRPYFCQLCGHYWRTEEKVMSHFFKASGCKALPLRRLRQPSKSKPAQTLMVQIYLSANPLLCILQPRMNRHLSELLPMVTISKISQSLQVPWL